MGTEISTIFLIPSQNSLHVITPLLDLSKNLNASLKFIPFYTKAERICFATAFARSLYNFSTG